MVLLVIAALLPSHNAPADITLLSGDFSAAESEHHFAPLTFQADVDGYLLIEMENPDGSADGEIKITNKTTSLAYNDGLFYGTTDDPLYNPGTWPRAKITQGRTDSTYALPVLADWGSCEYDVYYASRRGTENLGINSMTITYVPQALNLTDAELIATLVSEPTERNSASAQFDAGPGGLLLLNLLQTGTGGGYHSIYLDGRGIVYNQVGDPSRLMGLHTAIEVGPGTHNLMIRHEDDAWADNSGSRHTEVYFIPEPATLLLLGLGTLTLPKKRR